MYQCYLYSCKKVTSSVHHCWFIDFETWGVTFDGNLSGYGSFSTGNKFYNNLVNNCSKYHIGNCGEGGLKVGGQDGMLIYSNTITQTERPAGNNGFAIKYAGGFRLETKD